MSDEKKLKPIVATPQDDHATGTKPLVAQLLPQDDHATGAEPFVLKDDHATIEKPF
ncbi:hypothetical protein [Streptomyces cinnamoneus]|uniref:hypothetical protein n=1 Tax=Streptomyces cinnamoneus TaxID=53446 RepID=UPI0015E33685|nr:hypothetical protein [Streptomyces cinnamoneus]